MSDISALSGISGALSKGITITGAPNLASLNGLQNITSLGDRLFINGIPAVDLTGLQGITSITNSTDFPSTAVSILNCNNLISFNGLHNLTTITATGTVATAGFSITSNNNLSNISALNSVTSTLNYVFIQFNSSLTNCVVNAFCNMLSISNNGVNISSNNIGCGSNEEVLTACQNPDCPPSALIINSVASYNAFVSQFPNCTQINGDLMIIGNEITTLAGLSGITEINGNITISGTSQLANLDGLDNITSCNQLYIINNSNLTSLQGLNQLSTEYLTYMGISNNQLLTNLDGLNNIQGAQSIFISDNPVLENINGLSGISDRVEMIYIQSNDALNSIAGFSQINSVGIIFLSATSLTSLNGLNQLTEIGYNEEDENEDGDGSSNDRGGFNPGLFVYNTQIQNVDALSNLATINGSNLYFEYNDALLNLNGLSSLDGSSIGGIALTNNPLLSNCAVSSICERLELDLDVVTNIENNATGCEDVEAVETACELLSNQEISWIEANIYPNPFVNQIQLQWNESLKGDLKLVDITGKIIVEKSFEGQEFTIDQLDVLSSGIYFLMYIRN